MKKLLLIIFVNIFSILIGQITFSSLVRAQEPGSLLMTTPIKINGETWTFRTPPPHPAQREVISTHPRLYLTKTNLPALIDKLADPVYANDIKALKSLADKGNGLANAFLYQIEGDVSRGTTAKNWLLAGVFGDVGGLDTAANWVQPTLAFDWIMPLLSNSEKESIFNLVKANFGYDHRTMNPKELSWYNNNKWASGRPLHYPILALAIAGDGIDDTWAQEVLDLAYSESHLASGPYGATRGSGFLDVLATMSLDDGGGAQAGSYGTLGTHYYNMFLQSFMPLAAWESATGQPMWARCNFYRQIPFYWAYEKKKKPGNIGIPTLEFITGLYKDIDPDAAALARWMVDKWGRVPHVLVERLIFGDLRVIPKSPQELSLPTAKYIRGSDLFVSSSSWDENSITLSTYSRYLDTNRFEPGNGVFAIYRGQEPLAVPSEPLKAGIKPGHYSGLWIYDRSDVENLKNSLKSKSTYWSGDRASDAYTAVSESVYFPGGPDHIEINNTYRAISTEYGKLSQATGVRTARQTIIHIMDTDRDFIVVYDYSDVETNPNVKRAWAMRLATSPNIQGSKISISGGMHTTVVAPAEHTITWVGGVGDELKSPPPEKTWYGHRLKPGYSTDPVAAKKFGIGNLFVQSQNATEQLEFLVVNEVGDGVPVAVKRISDRQVKFGKWDVSFSKDGSFAVTGGTVEVITPTPPTGLKIAL